MDFFRILGAKDLSISRNLCKMRSYPAIICNFPEFRQNFVKFSTENDKFLENSNLNIFHEKKRNCAKTAKIEFGEVQKNANLVDLGKSCKMRLFSLS